jgi:hypothetical protein
MNSRQNISGSRRRFLGYGLKLTGLSVLLIPFQKVLATKMAVIDASIKKLYKFLPLDKLVLNTKTKVVHLPTGKIFAKYPTIRRQKIIGPANWEVEVRPPYHFNKEKSGIIIEVLALTRLAAGITDKTLTDAYRILSIAFTGTYKSKIGIVFNKYNFRLHHLLLQTIALNNTYPAAQKWDKFQQATARINYNLKEGKPLPRFMEWLKSKTEFDKKASYILKNKQTYMSRLAKRASQHKL